MSRPYHPLTITVLSLLLEQGELTYAKLHQLCARDKPYKFFYNIMYRLQSEGLVAQAKKDGKLAAEITKEGRQLLARSRPQRDHVWKLVIFDIPEKHKYVRNVLRAKLKALHFKKWQNSIWASPFALDEEIEKELDLLSKKFFVRLIKTTQINESGDLEKLFEQDQEVK